jgi:hypothetical protein
MQVSTSSRTARARSRARGELDAGVAGGQRVARTRIAVLSWRHSGSLPRAHRAGERASRSRGRVTRPLTAEQVARAFRDACLAELDALKPGNVHRFGDDDVGMNVADFETSARVAAPAIAGPGLSVGARIKRSVEGPSAPSATTPISALFCCPPPSPPRRSMTLQAICEEGSPRFWPVPVSPMRGRPTLRSDMQSLAD